LSPPAKKRTDGGSFEKSLSYIAPISLRKRIRACSDGDQTHLPCRITCTKLESDKIASAAPRASSSSFEPRLARIVLSVCRRVQSTPGIKSCARPVSAPTVKSSTRKFSIVIRYQS
jgi:hypothetical protein